MVIELLKDGSVWLRRGNGLPLLGFNSLGVVTEWLYKNHSAQDCLHSTGLSVDITVEA